MFVAMIRDFCFANGFIVIEVGFVSIFYSRCQKTRFEKLITFSWKSTTVFVLNNICFRESHLIMYFYLVSEDTAVRRAVQSKT